MSEERSLKQIQRDWPQTLRLYVIGFVGSLLLTGISFSLAAFELFPTKVLIAVLIFLALAQAYVQLVFFMHLGKEEKPRWMMLVFYFMILVVLIVALGSLWIIGDLNHRVMPEMPSMPMNPG
jgi:cytochrome o ubiquinol oxidase operon protein cyoD